ncbi:MAG: hypothetical protein D6788_01005 [Planctomycetota bacterium]|nr:MAG: hypothetical protein D6788_01005 [Planctomycetota bacterium]
MSTVRIKRQRISPTTAATLVVTLGAAGLIPLAWALWRGQPEPPPRQRTFREAEIPWHCENGHVFLAPGQEGARTCWICGVKAYAVGRFACPVHGPYEVEVRFVNDPDGQPVIGQVRLPGQDWKPRDEGLVCPRCNRPLFYVPPDPLEPLPGRARRKVP